MENFDNLPLEERIKRINEFAIKFTEAIKPIVEGLTKAFIEFGKAAKFAVDSVLTDDFKRRYMSEVKKERNRKSYYRMMARRRTPNN